MAKVTFPRKCSFIDMVTPLVLTYNEEANIERSIKKLLWAKKIVVIDSYSDDKTIEILKQYSVVKVYQRKFMSFASQCNYGISKVETEWILSLDADYVLSNEFIRELEGLDTYPSVDGYIAKLDYCVFGKPLKGTLLPPRRVLYRREKAIYHDDGHAHRVSIRGKVDILKSSIYHDDRKSLSRWLWAQDRYMITEAKKISRTPSTSLSFSDKLRKFKLIAPFAVLFYCLVLKGGIFDGWRGWYYAFQRVLAEILLSLKLMEVAAAE